MGAVTLENSLPVSQKERITIWPSNPTTGVKPEDMKTYVYTISYTLIFIKNYLLIVKKQK